MLIKVDSKRKGKPALKSAGKLIENAILKKRYRSAHSGLMISIWEVEERDEAPKVKKEKEVEDEDQGEIDNGQDQG